jgi:hypothetical protein
MAERPDHGSGDDPAWWQARERGQKPNFVELRNDELRRIPIPRTPVNKGKRRKGRSLLEVGTSAKTHLGELHPLAVVSYYVLGVD